MRRLLPPRDLSYFFRPWSVSHLYGRRCHQNTLGAQMSTHMPTATQMRATRGTRCPSSAIVRRRVLLTFGSLDTPQNKAEPEILERKRTQKMCINVAATIRTITIL